MADDAVTAAARQAVLDLRDLGDQAHAAARRLQDALLADQVQHRGTAQTFGEEAVTRRWLPGTPPWSRR